MLSLLFPLDLEFLNANVFITRFWLGGGVKEKDHMVDLDKARRIVFRCALNE